MLSKYSNNKIISCLCKGVKFKVRGQLRHVINCHCTQCMKTHGNYAAYTACLEKNITFINKKSIKWYKSSKIAKRGFCSNCGASIFYKTNNSKSISISAGLFKNPTKLKTNSNIFTKGKLDYYKLDNNIPKYHRYTKQSK